MTSRWRRMTICIFTVYFFKVWKFWSQMIGNRRALRKNGSFFLLWHFDIKKISVNFVIIPDGKWNVFYLVILSVFVVNFLNEWRIFDVRSLLFRLTRVQWWTILWNLPLLWNVCNFLYECFLNKNNVKGIQYHLMNFLHSKLHKFQVPL